LPACRRRRVQRRRCQLAMRRGAKTGCSVKPAPRHATFWGGYPQKPPCPPARQTWSAKGYYKQRLEEEEEGRNSQEEEPDETFTSAPAIQLKAVHTPNTRPSIRHHLSRVWSSKQNHHPVHASRQRLIKMSVMTVRRYRHRCFVEKRDIPQVVCCW